MKTLSKKLIGGFMAIAIAMVAVVLFTTAPQKALASDNQSNDVEVSFRNGGFDQDCEVVIDGKVDHRTHDKHFKEKVVVQKGAEYIVLNDGMMIINTDGTTYEIHDIYVGKSGKFFDYWQIDGGHGEQLYPNDHGTIENPVSFCSSLQQREN